jgi:superfamily II DNA or RNA helicase
MALQFELREQIPAGVRRWGGPTARTAAPTTGLLNEVRLAVRPVAKSTSGNWSRAGLTWSNLPYQASSANLLPEHQLWFSQFAALHRPLRDLQVNREPDWITLDDYQSPLLWRLFEEAQELGIEFVGGAGGSRGAEVAVARSARVSLDVQGAGAQAAHGGLTLRPLVTVDGVADPEASAGPVGAHGIYRFVLEPSPRVVLAPLDRPLTAERRELLAGRDEIVVPAEGVAEFLAEFAPELARTTGLTSADGSVDLPEPALPPAPPAPPVERELTDTPHLKVRTVPTEQADWFDLGIIVTVGDYDIPFGPLFTALAKGLTRYKLIDGTYLPLRQPVFERLFELISEAKELAEWETTPRLSRVQASLWADFEDLADETEEAVTWRASARGLLDASEIPAIEHGLAATLRPYQQQGFEWLAFLYGHKLGGILADDMGLGKTLQTLALMEHVRRTSPGAPFLVVAPTSVVSTWVSEAAKFAPGLRVAAVSSTRAGIADVAADADVVVTSYALFRLDFEAYRAVAWAGLILDEAQFVKNHAARVHRCARDLAAPFTLAITGTPLENNLTELWALFAIVAPGLFPSARRFTEEYVRPIERGEGERLERLRRRIRPLMLRRSKALVAPELPERQEQVLSVELQPEHRRLYDTVLQRERQKLFGLIDDVDRNRMIIFRSLTLLRMLSLDASLIDDAEHAGVPSSKLEVLVEQLGEVLAEGHRALVFSQFTSYLGLVAARLDAAGIAYAYLDGSTRQRGRTISEFKDGEAPVFLISLKAGGFGLTLTEADYVFLLDPWWNPAAENQAIDRTHRIGQTRNVMVYRMIAADTIEEKVLELSRRKAGLFTSVLDEGDLFSAELTGDDIRWLVEG